MLPLDPDDRIAPKMLERTVAVFEAEPSVSIAYVQMMSFGDKTTEGTSGTIEYDADLLAVWNFLCISSLYRKYAWDLVGGYRTDLVWGYEDWDFWLTCAAAGLVMKRVPEVFFYRVRRGSRSTEAREHRGRAHAAAHPSPLGVHGPSEARSRPGEAA